MLPSTLPVAHESREPLSKQLSEMFVTAQALLEPQPLVPPQQLLTPWGSGATAIPEQFPGSAIFHRMRQKAAQSRIQAHDVEG